jgi:hypothetical protein
MSRIIDIDAISRRRFARELAFLVVVQPIKMNASAQ